MKQIVALLVCSFALLGCPPDGGPGGGGGAAPGHREPGWGRARVLSTETGLRPEAGVEPVSVDAGADGEAPPEIVAVDAGGGMVCVSGCCYPPSWPSLSGACSCLDVAGDGCLWSEGCASGSTCSTPHLVAGEPCGACSPP